MDRICIQKWILVTYLMPCDTRSLIEGIGIPKIVSFLVK
nr:MAG TPA: hypothetical protein [Caudoviricetes sp.]DAV83499.1 MAG TPA: hypothetical protein [Caudoviricetes sp.]